MNTFEGKVSGFVVVDNMNAKQVSSLFMSLQWNSGDVIVYPVMIGEVLMRL